MRPPRRPAADGPAGGRAGRSAPDTRPRPRRTAGPVLPQPRRHRGRHGQECQPHRRAGRTGLRLSRTGHRHSAAPARQSQTAPVPPSPGPGHHQPLRLQQRGAGSLRAPRPCLPGLAEAPGAACRRPLPARHPAGAGPEHWQECRHPAGIGHARLPHRPGCRHATGRLRGRQHLVAQHRQPAQAAGRQRTGRAAGGPGPRAPASGHLGGPQSAPVAQDRTGPRRRPDCRHHRSAGTPPH